MRSKMKNRRYTNARERAERQNITTVSACLRIPEGVSLFKPKEGVVYIDILPYETGEGNPYADPGTLHWERTYWIHRGIGTNSETILCPRMTRKAPCPICEHRAKLIKEASEENEELIRDLAPKQRQLFNIIDVKEPDKGVQIWDISYHMFGKLLDHRIRNSDEDEGWDRFFHLEDGFTLRVSFSEKTLGSFAYVEAESIDFKPRRQPYDEEILEKVHCLDKLLVELPYEKIKAMFLQVEEMSMEPKTRTVEVSEEEETEEEEESPRVKAVDIEKLKEDKKPSVEDEEEEDDWEEEEPVRPKPSVAKPKAKPVVEEEEEEEDEWDEPKPKPNKPASKQKPKVEVEDEEEEDDGWGDEDEDEEPAPKPSKKKVAVKEEEDEEEEEEVETSEEDEEDDWGDLDDWDDEPKKKK